MVIAHLRAPDLLAHGPVVPIQLGLGIILLLLLVLAIRLVMDAIFGENQWRGHVAIGISIPPLLLLSSVVIIVHAVSNVL